MSSIVISGDTSGSVTLQAPAIAGSTVVTLPTTSMNIGTGGGSVATNTAFGTSALAANTTGANNVAVGRSALTANTTASYNTAVGLEAGYANTTGLYETFVGAYAGAGNTTGEGNSALGVQALEANTTGGFNVAVGRLALKSNTTASNNTAVGYQAGYSTTTAGRNTLVGQIAGYALTTGGANVVVGDNAFKAATTAENSVAIGTYALAGTTTGNFNTAVGGGAGEAITTGSKNSILGRYNGNQGGLDIRTANNNIVLSDGDGNPRGYFDSSGRMLINTTATQARLTVLDASDWVIASMRTGTGGEGHIRFDNANGNVGYIQTTGTTTQYVTSSDYRLKNTIAPMTGALAKVALLKPCTYKWNADGSDGQGFIAHELAEVVPGCVAGEKDEVDVDGNPKYQGVDTSFLVATLTAAIQEQQALITALTTRITALEAKVGA